VDEKHHAGVTEFAGNRQSLGGSEAYILETLFKIDLAAAAGEGWITKGCDFEEYVITAPAVSEGIRLHNGIELVPSMGELLRG
jgi:hypothetical protein